MTNLFIVVFCFWYWCVCRKMNWWFSISVMQIISSQPHKHTDWSWRFHRSINKHQIRWWALTARWREKNVSISISRRREISGKPQFCKAYAWWKKYYYILLRKHRKIYSWRTHIIIIRSPTNLLHLLKIRIKNSNSASSLSTSSCIESS